MYIKPVHVFLPLARRCNMCFLDECVPLRGVKVELYVAGVSTWRGPLPPNFSLSFSPLGGGMTLWRLWKMELGISLWNLPVGRHHILLCFTEQLVA